jgi:hypothetical protein
MFYHSTWVGPVHNFSIHFDDTVDFTDEPEASEEADGA